MRIPLAVAYARSTNTVAHRPQPTQLKSSPVYHIFINKISSHELWMHFAQRERRYQPTPHHDALTVQLISGVRDPFNRTSIVQYPHILQHFHVNEISHIIIAIAFIHALKKIRLHLSMVHITTYHSEFGRRFANAYPFIFGTRLLVCFSWVYAIAIPFRHYRFHSSSIE